MATASKETCPDCKGSGRYTGLLKSESCSRCGGFGSIVEATFVNYLKTIDTKKLQAIADKWDYFGNAVSGGSSIPSSIPIGQPANYPVMDGWIWCPDTPGGIAIEGTVSALPSMRYVVLAPLDHPLVKYPPIPTNLYMEIYRSGFGKGAWVHRGMPTTLPPAGPP